MCLFNTSFYNNNLNDNLYNDNDFPVGIYNPDLAYTCHNGFIRSSLLACSVILTDHNPGYGGFCVVPGK